MKNQTQVQRKNSRRERSAQPQPATVEIPTTWKEVTTIDFTGYIDRDCEAREIYKTPDGKLKAVLFDDDCDQRIEEVSREQVTKWIHQCFIPKEFEGDFVIRLRRNDSHFDAKARLERKMHEHIALTEALSVLVSACQEADYQLLSNNVPETLMSIARDKGAELREAFEYLIEQKGAN